MSVVTHIVPEVFALHQTFTTSRGTTASHRSGPGDAFGLTKYDQLQGTRAVPKVEPADEVDTTIAGSLGNPAWAVLTARPQGASSDFRRQTFKAMLADALV